MPEARKPRTGVLWALIIHAELKRRFVLALVPTSHMHVQWKSITKELFGVLHTMSLNWWQFIMTPAHIWHSPNTCDFHQSCSLRQEFKAKQACWHPEKPRLSGCSLAWGVWSSVGWLCNGHVGTHHITASAFSIFSSLILTQLGVANRLWGCSFQHKPHACYSCCQDCRVHGRGKVFINKLSHSGMTQNVTKVSLQFSFFHCFVLD